MSSIAPASSDYRTATEACGLLDRSERGKLALTGREAKSFLQGQVTNDVEALSPGEGCYAAFLTPKGKMLGDLRILDAGDEILLDTERVALQELFNMIRRFSIGFDVELHKRTLESGLLSLLGPESEAVAGGGGLGEPEHSNSAVDRGRDRGAGDPDRPRDRPAVRRSRCRRLRAALATRGAAGVRGRGRMPPGRARAPPLRRGPRRHRDPPGGRAQRARRVVHQGLLRRPGDRRAPALPRQAQPPSPRAAARADAAANR